MTTYDNFCHNKKKIPKNEIRKTMLPCQFRKI